LTDSGAEGNPSPSPSPPNTLGTSPPAGYAERANNFAQIENENNARVFKIPQLINFLSTTNGLLKSIKPGPGGDTRAKMGYALQTLQNLGIDVDPGLIDKVGGGSQSDIATFRSVVNQAVVQGFRDMMAGVGNPIADSYQNWEKGTGIGTSTPDDAIPKILRYMTSQYKTSLGFVKGLARFRKEHKPGEEVTGFVPWYIKNGNLEEELNNQTMSQAGPKGPLIRKVGPDGKPYYVRETQ
jgi:hypothetical protein